MDSDLWILVSNQAHLAFTCPLKANTIQERQTPQHKISSRFLRGNVGNFSFAQNDRLLDGRRSAALALSAMRRPYPATKGLDMMLSMLSLQSTRAFMEETAIHWDMSKIYSFNLILRTASWISLGVGLAC